MSSKKGPEAPWTLAARLTLWYTASAFTVVLVATGYLYFALRGNLEREDMEFLADQIQILRILLREHPEDAAAIKQEVELESSVRQHARVYVRILSEDGTTVAETPEMRSELGREVFPEPQGTDARPERALHHQTPAGRPYRILAVRAAFGDPPRGTRVLQLALDASQEETLLAGFRLRMMLALGIALVVCALVGHRLARRGIRPVEEISRTAGHIQPSTLNERIREAGLPAELLELARTFNGMLSRLEDSFARLSQFSADIAHELRTPLNNLRGEVEVALGKPRSPEEYREVLASCLEEHERLSRIIDSLLFLARAENPQTQIRREPLDVAAELAAVREFYEAAAAEAGVCLRLEAPAGVSAELDRTLLQRAAGNLVENALAHTPSGGTVTLRAAPQNGNLQVEVADTGRGIPPEHLPHVFERFYRVDRSRTASTGGMGLGLAIVRSIAELHGGTARIESEPGRGTRVTLLLPRKAAGQKPSEP
jgi:two-component system heavy metal sensor histidine kinase CusS